MTKWLVFQTSAGQEVVIIPPLSPHPEMEVGLIIKGERVYLTRELAQEIGEELMRQANIKRGRSAA
jgi:CRISPR/Cas system-associated protein Csm6